MRGWWQKTAILTWRGLRGESLRRAGWRDVSACQYFCWEFFLRRVKVRTVCINPEVEERCGNLHFAYSIVVAKHVNSFEGFLHFFCGRKCTSHSRFPTMHSVSFSFTASRWYVAFIKAKLCFFSFKISMQRAQHVQFARVLFYLKT